MYHGILGERRGKSLGERKEKPLACEHYIDIHYDYISSLIKGRSVSNNNRYLSLTKQNIAVHCIFFFRHWPQFYYSRTCKA